ncbi:hypothetical protein LGL08_21365 [Clostridium estertheticum]|uniref:hypothetical protein n=1 Tax=Clostridium estertheticum TaxID=238834 RepID=UPI001CF588CF|nr:hypothetical protein [Clostridium estertheticum]MCB2309067.1 hypothetical protein [Clostridium estertheticum]MCB2347814.1 hypothetical protein [Clostridium estertheticum]MCB2352077.1 hypothetical protein [Clostridium estertheticum]WAG45362.1 hypothetical protein LL127_17820 [Clostridium estertheticum]
MIKKSFKIKSILILILIPSILLILSSCKQLSPNINNNKSLSNSDSIIGPANLTSEVKNLIKIGGADVFYVFEVKNQKENYKKISCWVDLFEGGKLKTSFGKMTSMLQGRDNVKYISIALNNSSIDNNNNNKREFITSIISNNSISQGRIIDKIDSKLGEASVANQEQKLLEGQDINLAAFIQNEGSTSTFNSISENMKEILKNKKVYIFRCKLEK